MGCWLHSSVILKGAKGRSHQFPCWAQILRYLKRKLQRAYHISYWRFINCRNINPVQEFWLGSSHCRYLWAVLVEGEELLTWQRLQLWASGESYQSNFLQILYGKSLDLCLHNGFSCDYHWVQIILAWAEGQNLMSGSCNRYTSFIPGHRDGCELLTKQPFTSLRVLKC